MGSWGWEEVGSRGWEEVAPQSLDGDHGDRGDHDDGVHLVHPSASHDGGGRNVPIRVGWSRTSSIPWSTLTGAVDGLGTGALMVSMAT